MKLTALTHVLFAVLLASCGIAAKGESTSSPIAVAERYVGLHAHRDRNTLKNFLEIDPRLIPWCAAFVNRVLEISGLQGTDSLMARSFLNFGQAVKLPRVGDIVVLRRGSNPASGHVGFYMGEGDQGRIRVLGGNQRHQVSIAEYPRGQVLGYRRVKSQTQPLRMAMANQQSRTLSQCSSYNYAWTAPVQCSALNVSE